MKTHHRNTVLLAGGFLGLLLLLSGKSEPQAPAPQPQPPPPPPPLPPAPAPAPKPPEPPAPEPKDPFASGTMVKVVTPEGASLRDAPSGKLIDVIPAGVFVKVLAANVEPYAEWVYVQVPASVADRIFVSRGNGDVSGYVLLTDLGGTPPPRKVETVDSLATVSTPTPVYTEADVRSETLTDGLLPVGKEVHVIAINHGAASDFSKLHFDQLDVDGFVKTTNLSSDWKPFSNT